MWPETKKFLCGFSFNQPNYILEEWFISTVNGLKDGSAIVEASQGLVSDAPNEFSPQHSFIKKILFKLYFNKYLTK
jgi:hypothetical protein